MEKQTTIRKDVKSMLYFYEALKGNNRHILHYYVPSKYEGVN